MFDIITIGGASRDVFFMTEEAKLINDLKHHQKLIAFDYGAKIIPEECEFTYGGGALNSAVCCAKIGLKVATVMNIGSEGTGSLVVKDLEADGVSTEFITRDHVNHTAMSIIVSLPNEDHTMFLYRGSNNFLKVHDWRPMRTKWFYLSSLTGESADLIPELFSYARAHDIKIAWNPGCDQLAGGYEDLSSYLEETDVLILNREEAEQLVLSKNKKTRVRDEKILLHEIKQMIRGLVVVTNGEEGSYVTDGERDFFEPAHSVEVLETTGAGDAYGATFVAVHMMGYGLKYAMKMAAQNAASVVRYIGAQKGLLTFSILSAIIDSSSESGEEK
jgi:ribokinase